MTHEVRMGVTLARRQFIIDSSRGSLRCTVWERKFVDRIRRYKASVEFEEEGGGDLRPAGGLVWWL
jgi:hypothetical protein